MVILSEGTLNQLNAEGSEQYRYAGDKLFISPPLRGNSKTPSEEIKILRDALTTKGYDGLVEYSIREDSENPGFYRATGRPIIDTGLRHHPRCF